MKRATSPQSYPAITRRNQRELVFARPFPNKATAFVGLLLFGGGGLACLFVLSAVEGSFWASVIGALVAGFVAYVLFVESFHVERLSMDLERRSWRLRRGILGFRKVHGGGFEALSHLSLETEDWDMDDSPPFKLWSVWLHFQDPAIEKYCLGVRPRGLQDLHTDPEHEARDLLHDIASALGLPITPARR